VLDGTGNRDLCGAAPNGRSVGRINQRNGCLDHDLQTRARTVELRIPRLRHGASLFGVQADPSLKVVNGCTLSDRGAGTPAQIEGDRPTLSFAMARVEGSLYVNNTYRSSHIGSLAWATATSTFPARASPQASD
jgi:hypothetical protein